MKVLLFASLVDLVGQDQVSWNWDKPIQVGSFLAALEEAYPELKRYQRCFRVAVNQEFVDDEHWIEAQDEVALIPPVSGGSGPHLRAALSSDPLNIDRLTQEVMDCACGAVVTFLGTVRELTGDLVTHKLEYSAYQGMAEKKMLEICQEASARWPIKAAVVEHRIGSLLPGEVAVVAACSAPHRQQAFEACQFLIDTTKSQVPLWKKEFGPDGEFWPEQRVD